MDITHSNFEETLPIIEEAINSAEFIAIDTEFTGLRNGPDVTVYDTPSEYYCKLRDGSSNFLLIQVGICTFKYNKLKNKYVYKAFNFYVFPRTVNASNNDVNFLCQASSINFLSNNGFDFNKLFKEGIPYLSVAQEETLQEELVTKYEHLNNTESYSKVPIPPELTSTIENVCERIKNFLLPENAEKEMIIDKCNGFMRKLIFQMADERFSTKNFNLTTEWIDNCPVLVAHKGKSKAEQNKENYEKDRNEIKNAVGFFKVIKYVSDSKKLIVGHNMFLDICHIVNRFFWPLPESYWEFKEMVHQLFPKLIDTKYMCSAYPFRDLIPSSVMSHMIEKIKEPPFQFPDAEPESAEFEYSEAKCKNHEAGYDAYMTGLAFIALTSFLGNKSKKNKNKINVDVLNSYENRLFLMKILDYSYANLKGEEPKPSRKYVFHVTFPKNWKTSDIMQLFSPYGNIHVSYCNQITAWVTLLNQEKCESVVADLVAPNSEELPGLRKPYTVITWREFNEKNSLTDKSNVVSSQSRQNRLLFDSSLPVEKNETASVFSAAPVEGSHGEKQTAEHGKKRSDEINVASRKRKKNEQNDTENLVFGESSETNERLPESSTTSKNTWFNKLLKMKKELLPKRKNNLLFEPPKGKEDNLRRTFEEPSWE